MPWLQHIPPRLSFVRPPAGPTRGGTRIAVHGRHLSLDALAPPNSRTLRTLTGHTPPLTHTHLTHTHGTYVCGFGYAWAPLECWCAAELTISANQSTPPLMPARNRSTNATNEIRCACTNSTVASLASAGATGTPSADGGASGASHANQTNRTNQTAEEVAAAEEVACDGAPWCHGPPGARAVPAVVMPATYDKAYGVLLCDSPPAEAALLPAAARRGLDVSLLDEVFPEPVTLVARTVALALP